MAPRLLCDAELRTHQTRFVTDTAECRTATDTERDTVEELAALRLIPATIKAMEQCRVRLGDGADFHRGTARLPAGS